jgi:hypothetical protein
MDRNALKKLLLSTLVVITSIVLAGASITLVLYLLHTNQISQTGLATRISINRTVLFVRADRSSTFAHIIRGVAPNLTATPIPATVLDEKEGHGIYEFAVIKTGTGAGVQWIISTTASGSTQATILSETDPSALLTIRKGEQTLADDLLFRRTVSDATKNVLWADLRSPLPLARNTASTLLKAALTPYETALLVWNEPAQGDLILRRSVTSPGKSVKTTPLPILPEDALLVLRHDRPLELIDSPTALLNHENPEIIDGVTGILKSLGDRYAHTTDIRSFGEGMLKNPATIAVIPGSEGTTPRIVLAGEASNARIIETWAAALASAMTPSIVRSEQFFKENSRRDVVAAMESVRAEEDPIGNWNISRIGASGASVIVFIAHRGRQFAVSTDAGLLRSTLEKNEIPLAAVAEQEDWGTADIHWLLSFTESVTGNAGTEIRGLTDALFGTDLRRIRWQTNRRPDADRFRWSVERPPFPSPSHSETTGKQ